MNLTWGLGVGAAACGAIAAICAIKATTIRPITVAEMDPSDASLRPRSTEHHTFQMMNALDAQQYFAGQWNFKAAIFGALAAILGLAAYFI